MRILHRAGNLLMTRVHPSRENMRMSKFIQIVGTIVFVAFISGCAKRQPPATPAPEPEAPPPPVAESTAKPAPPPAPPPVRVEDTQPVRPVAEDDGISSRPLDDINRNSPLKPAFFVVDSAELDDAARGIVTANADVMRKYGSWVVTIEGHADERGTAEYNLALGERRALAVKTYLVSLGIPPDRLRTISYGKEFPFDPGHDDGAWSKNRRAHFVVTSK